MTKIRVGIVAGGQSSEHEISCISAAGILGAIDRNKFEPVLIGITKSGKWVLPLPSTPLTIIDGQLPSISEDAPMICADLNEFSTHASPLNLDLLFPVLHGPYGEDGTFQGMCEMAGFRYVGSGVLASATAMDKSFAKAIFSAHGLKVAEGLTVNSRDWPHKANDINGRAQSLGLPLFVKPARGGSSRGTTKVKEISALNSAIEEALQFDSKVMIEKGIIGREIECGVLQVSGVTQVCDPGEVKISPEHEFYDFTAKYLDGATEFVTGIDLPDAIKKNITTSAKLAFEALGCEGLARVDFFLDNNGEVIINEINTMPGFTATSVFPKLWKEAGIGYTELITILIESAMSRSMSVTR
ncbi:unannotated protein [freshwater metagenome]|uniref:Unannotated protein n=1 Tax=freshwater metagenome TaxID=449393 RepID=A0A6J6AXM6_9ZZZZ|nr:D-alanine--D-alanine ligase [Actinomycetota bacterium]MSW98939.1 D-alanine--D-alanine ligase [Actinomycetota bacterium]MSY81869.1 D-alanine--D-alanine ligase [Actinomycetota bacterium]MSZ45410.1 D-alanine--D-alanine ligase [Actinomycetota bacterium]MTA04266.1 D-alanine--D-alanine ligase [Actinomycetota bacterium]